MKLALVRLDGERGDVVVLDLASRQYMALAIRQATRRLGDNAPEALRDAEFMLAEGDRSGQMGTDGDRSAAGDHGEGYNRAEHDGHVVLTQKQVAAELGCSARTVRRMLDRGDLRGVRVGARRAIPRSELERLTRGGRDA